jgi:hypothetical protein
MVKNMKNSTLRRTIAPIKSPKTFRLIENFFFDSNTFYFLIEFDFFTFIGYIFIGSLFRLALYFFLNFLRFFINLFT